jgi:dTDP-D-glucose 4,6-dehydratase
LVTGGAEFIESNMVDTRCLADGAHVIKLDDMIDNRNRMADAPIA